MNTQRAYIFLLIFIAFLPASAFAADAIMELSPSVGTYRVYDDVTLRVLVSSDNQKVSAVEGRLSYNPKELTITHITKEDSPISSWTQEPFVDSELGEVLFGGALATATKMKSTAVLTLRVRPERSGETLFRFEGGAAIISADGLGSNILTSFKSGKYRIIPEELSDETLSEGPSPAPSKNSSTTEVAGSEVLGIIAPTPPPPVVDRTPPAGFVLSEVPGRSLGDPDIVVNVTATDSESGIDHYTFAIDDGEPSLWEDRGTHHFVYHATVLGSHTLTGIVYDRAGNASLSKITFTVTDASATPTIANTQHIVDTNPASVGSVGGVLSRHPFLPAVFALLLLIVFFTFWILRDISFLEDEEGGGEVNEDLAVEEVGVTGQIVLPSIKK